MKNKFLVCIITFLSFFIIACSSNTPKDVAISFVEEMYKHGDSQDALKYIDMPNDDTTKNFMLGKIQMATQQLHERSKEWGGVKNIEVISEDIKENTANVKLKIIYENGKETTENINLKKIDGQWKISI